MGLISFLLGSDNRKHLKQLNSKLYKIDSYTEKYKKLTDQELREKTADFKKRIKDNHETLDDLLPEAFALVREASTRVLGMTHFPVQLLGGMSLHQGRISEMRTGEGKTLVSTLPAYLNALEGQGVHIVTVNDYLAQRDAEWMGKIHRFLGLSVGVVIAGMSPQDKKKAYACDITYATNNELGFDYLRDNMCIYKEEKVQRSLHFAIIDEVDSILIDEARTPLIISGAGGKSSEMYVTANRFVKSLKKGVKVKDDFNKIIESDGDFEIDEKKKSINLAPEGITKAEKYFNIENLSDLENTELNHYINNALRANYIMKRDSDYIINDGEVLIVDEFTGRVMVGRRYSDGLHQAIEAKENVRIQSENKTLATITFQNYFRLYKKLGGMTGTAKTEENEFKDIYGLDVVVIPPNKTNARIDENDQVYTTNKGKLHAIVEDVVECYKRGQPVLVGTTTVDKSEEVSVLLKKMQVPHSVLNAKNHAREAEIVAQAGRYNAVTIATNMAGRGTDILLGGNAEYMAIEELRQKEGVTDEILSLVTSKLTINDVEVQAAKQQFEEYYEKFLEQTKQEKEKVISVGGLRIVGTERHESRRIDNQLRGRAGRQGDVGSSVFYLSMEDDLLRLFAGEKLQRLARLLRIDENTPLSMRILTRQIATAQKRIEGRNFSVRRHVLEYDDVMNTQRKQIYQERGQVLDGMVMSNQIKKMFEEQVNLIVDEYTDIKTDWDGWDLEELNKEIGRKLLPDMENFVTNDNAKKWTIDEIKVQINAKMSDLYGQKIKIATDLGVDFEEVERVVLLKIVDRHWMAHIDDMDILKRGIGLKAYGQTNPVTAYKKEGFDMFDIMLNKINEETVAILMRLQVEKTPERAQQAPQQFVLSGGSDTGGNPNTKQAASSNAVGRNELCPCGSGQKYKNCCINKK
ncbi:MAG: preprotein translocase subunit SecA [Clostridiales bacterium]|jgi:preprotein translocase subunit SecA|nr:preprotein translocase subunit SecA [Clostridiales bacterium]